MVLRAKPDTRRTDLLTLSDLCLGTGLDRLSPARSQNGSPHDDSVAHNIESLERIQAKLTGIAK